MELSEIIGNYLSQSLFQQPLTEDQKSTLEEILDQYDPENMTEEDRRSLRAQLREADIPRCAETGRMLREAGLLAAPPEEARADSPSLLSETAKKPDSNLLKLIERYESGEIDQEEFMSLIQGYAESGVLTTGSLLDETA